MLLKRQSRKTWCPLWTRLPAGTRSSSWDSTCAADSVSNKELDVATTIARCIRAWRGCQWEAVRRWSQSWSSDRIRSRPTCHRHLRCPRHRSCHLGNRSVFSSPSSRPLRLLPRVRTCCHSERCAPSFCGLIRSFLDDTLGLWAFRSCCGLRFLSWSRHSRWSTMTGRFSWEIPISLDPISTDNGLL